MITAATGTLQLTHVIPGRIRLRWSGPAALPGRLIADLRQVDQMTQVEYRECSRSLLLVHSNGFDVGKLRSLAEAHRIAVAPGSLAPAVPAQDACASYPRGSAGPETPAPPAFRASRPGICVIHALVPGRVRLRVAALRRRPRACQRLTRHLEAVPGVRRACASPTTGTLLVEFIDTRQTVGSLVSCVDHFLRTLPHPGEEPGGAPGGAAWSEHSPAPAELHERYQWYAKASAVEALQRIASREQGLTDAEATRRAAELGPRQTELEWRRPAGEILREQLVSVPSAVLAGGAVLAAVTHGLLDAAVIVGVLLLNSFIAFYTERRAEAAIDALQRLGFPRASVLRSGERRVLPADQLVPGDVIRLMAGDLVPADARLIEGTLLVDEAMLTGESQHVAKHPYPTPAPARTHEFANVVFQGTAVIYGRARALVVATGRDTELGRIQALVHEARPPRTALQLHLDLLGKRLAIGAGGVCGALLTTGILRRQPLVRTIQNSVTLAVSAVPEALPTIAMAALAVGTQRMLQRQVIVRKLPAVESLGSVTTLCVDKTGTLTLNQMRVSSYWYDGTCVQCAAPGDGAGCFRCREEWVDPRTNPVLDSMLQVGALCSEAKLNRENGTLSVSGSATEGALLYAAKAAGYSIGGLRRAQPLAAVVRRSPNQARMATFHSSQGGYRICVKGAPETVLEQCAFRMDVSGNAVPLTDADRDCCRSANQQMAHQGLRVLALAESWVSEGAAPAPEAAGAALQGLTWLGLVGMEDPLRPDVAEAIRRCEGAGVRTVILTGDQRGTALAVARRLGLPTNGSAVLEAADLEQLEGEALSQALDRTAIYARVSPADKLRIVRDLQARGEVVAMTGDGINDGPALKAADIGIAMGMGSSDVAKELADVVLTRNDFSSIVVAVEQGRIIFANIRRAVRYLVGTNVADLVLAGAMLVLGIPFPFHPIQILWLNLVTDFFPALALVLEPTDREVMRQPPRAVDTPVLDERDWRALGGDAVVLAGSVLATYLWAAATYGAGPAAAAIAFTALTLGETFYAVAHSGWGQQPSLRRHGLLWGSMAAAVALQLAMNHWAPLRGILHGAPLGGVDYAVALVAAVVPTLWSLARQHLLLPLALPAPRRALASTAG